MLPAVRNLQLFLKQLSKSYPKMHRIKGKYAPPLLLPVLDPDLDPGRRFLEIHGLGK